MVHRVPSLRSGGQKVGGGVRVGACMDNADNV